MRSDYTYSKCKLELQLNLIGIFVTNLPLKLSVDKRLLHKPTFAEGIFRVRLFQRVCEVFWKELNLICSKDTFAE
jgi:hypothetical protein